MQILAIRAREILDSRGNPTVEADVILEDGSLGRASVPSGASTGHKEAAELRDGDPRRFGGLGVLRAVGNINGEIAVALKGLDAANQSGLDQRLIQLDGTENKARLGANAILAVSLAAARASAGSLNIPMYEYIAKLSGATPTSWILPLPMFNIVNGGKHAMGGVDIQEYVVMPIGAPSFPEAMRMGTEIFHTLGQIFFNRGYSNTVGDEGGYAPTLRQGNLEGFDLIMEAITTAGYKPGTDVALGLDVAASELYSNGNYLLKTENRILKPEEMVAWLASLAEKYPIISIEDGLADDDWTTWQNLTAKLVGRCQIVGDDLTATNVKHISQAITQKAANAVIIKPNQIGTLTETIAALETAKTSGWNTVISHRSGETEDNTIAHLAVGLNAGQIKSGSLSRSERLGKYNELLRIAERLGDKATFYHFSQIR